MKVPDDNYKNYKFTVQIDGKAPIGFNDVKGFTPPLDGVRECKSSGFSNVTFEREITSEGNDFYEWVKEVMPPGPMRQDVSFKDPYGQDIEIWFWKKWVPRWLVGLLSHDWVHWMWQRRKKWFMRHTNTLKNAYPIAYGPVDSEGEEDVTITELTLGGE